MFNFVRRIESSLKEIFKVKYDVEEHRGCDMVKVNEPIDSSFERKEQRKSGMKKNESVGEIKLEKRRYRIWPVAVGLHMETQEAVQLPIHHSGSRKLKFH